MAFCPNCGANLTESEAFCPHCGTRSEQPVAPVTPQPIPQPNYAAQPIMMPLEEQPVAAPPVYEEAPAGNQSVPLPKKKKIWLWILMIVLILALIGGGVFAYLFFGAKESKGYNVSLGEFMANEVYFQSGKEATITFTVKISGEAEKVELFCDDDAVETMNDNGENGDLTPGDGIYTCVHKKTVKAEDSVIHQFQAKAHEKGSEPVSVYFFNNNDLILASGTIQQVDQAIREIEKQYNSDGTDEERTESAKKVWENVKGYLDDLKGDGTVLEYTEEEDTITVIIGGITYIYEFDPDPDQTVDPQPPINNTPGLGVAGEKQVVSVQPYASTLKTGVFDSAAAKVGELSGYQYAKDINNEDVTVEFMKTLHQYDVIVWDGFCGYTSQYHSYLGIGESAENCHLYGEYVVGSRPGVVVLSNGCLGVTPYFFEGVYEEGDFDNAVLYMGGSDTATDRYLADVFFGFGANAYYGYKNVVSTTYNRNMADALFQALTQLESEAKGTKTVTNSLTQAKNAHGNTDSESEEWNGFCAAMGWTTQTEPTELLLYTRQGQENYRLLVPSGTLIGKVCMASDRTTPIVGANVAVYSGDTLCQTVTSDAQGSYMAKLAVGEYRLDITAAGYIDFTCYAQVIPYDYTYTETFLLITGSQTQTGTAQGVIRHALTGVTEQGVTLSVFKSWNNKSGNEQVATYVTGADGSYSFQLPLGNYTVKAYKEGFVDCYFNIIVQSGTTENQNGTITPQVSGNQFLITLTWDEYPADLDSHVEGYLSDGSSFHVDYEYSENRDYDPGYVVKSPPKDGDTVVCRLDCDDIESYGPEHITLQTTTQKPYYYYVHNYTPENGNFTYSGARVTVHQGNSLIADFHVPTNQSNDDYWNVFAIVNGEIVISNTLSGSPDLDYASQ